MKGPTFFMGLRENLPSEYELKQVAPTYLKKVGMEKFHGEYREKFVFNSRKFFESLFSHLPIQNLKQYTKVCIFGYNERGIILGKYLANLGHNNIKFVDNYFGQNKNYSESSDFEISTFDDLDSCMNSCFILAMSSHHWNSTTEQILLKYPDSEILKIDRSKILHLTTYLQGGAGKVVLDLAKRSKAKGGVATVGFTKKSVKGYCNYPKHIDALKKAQINQIELPTTFDRKPSKIIGNCQITTGKIPRKSS